MRSRAAMAGWAVALVVVVVAVVVVEALTHSGVGMWFGLASVVVIAVALGARFFGPHGGPGGGGGSGGCGPGGC